MNISVDGLGIVSRMGYKEDIEFFLERGSAAGQSQSGPHVPADIPESLGIPDKLVRRMSHFARLSLLSAARAVIDSGIDIRKKSTGIIQGSVYGPIISGLQCFDDLLDFGDNQLSPANFSGSVFNTSATYLSLAFGIEGRTMTHTSGQDTLYNSLMTASQWLEQGEAEYIIMGIGDEYTSFFDGGIPLQAQAPKGFIPDSEGWTTFVLSGSRNPLYGKINCGRLDRSLKIKNKNIIYSAWHELIKPDEFYDHSLTKRACFPGPLRGSYPTASCFDLALALICAKKGRFPVSNPEDRNYNIEELDKNEKIACFNLSETEDIFYYETQVDS